MGKVVEKKTTTNPQGLQQGAVLGSPLPTTEEPGEAQICDSSKPASAGCQSRGVGGVHDRE